MCILQATWNCILSSLGKILPKFISHSRGKSKNLFCFQECQITVSHPDSDLQFLSTYWVLCRKFLLAKTNEVILKLLLNTLSYRVINLRAVMFQWTSRPILFIQNSRSLKMLCSRNSLLKASTRSRVFLFTSWAVVIRQ